jgi:hypothetical protein
MGFTGRLRPTVIFHRLAAGLCGYYLLAAWEKADR